MYIKVYFQRKCWYFGTRLEWVFRPESLEYHDQINLLKAAIYYSDNVINSKSNICTEQIQTKMFGHDLENTLIANNYKLEGILNGVSWGIQSQDWSIYLWKLYKKSYKLKLKTNNLYLKILVLLNHKSLFLYL